MKKYHLSLMVVVTCLSANVSFAYDGWSAGEIDEIRYQKSRTLITQFGATNPGQCSDHRYIMLREDGSDFAKRANAVLLAAQISGKTAKIILSGCSHGENTGYPVLSEVLITND